MTDSLYLGWGYDGKQIGLYKTSEQAFQNPKVKECEFWDLHEKTGRYCPTGNKICKLTIVEKEQTS